MSKGKTKMTDYTPDNEPEVNVEYDFDAGPNLPVTSASEVPCDTQLMTMALIACSRQPDREYEVGQYGDREFTASEHLTFCYRLEVPCTDKQIKAYLNNHVRAMAIIRTKRNHFVASTLFQYSMEALKQESTRLLARPQNPTKS